jgi:hypothetical protein
MNILRFEMNVPAEVALDSAQGVVVEGRYGARMRFNLADGRVMYVPPIVASKITAEAIVPGERFHLCKAAVRTGQKRSVEWLLERINPEQTGQRVNPKQTAERLADGIPAAEPETPLERNLRMSRRNGERQKRQTRASAGTLRQHSRDAAVCTCKQRTQRQWRPAR